MERSALFKNLNVFFPYYALFAYALGNFTNVFLRLLLSGIIDFDRYHNQMVVGVQFAALLILLVIWKLYGLSPRPRKKSISTSRKGHFIIAIGNFALLGVVAFLAILAVGYGALGNALFLAIPVFVLSIVAWFVGVVMIWVAK
ncbi:MAG: hypothetical protein KZQ80_11585 [Candidatus Thiodiazotropha sp. (ex Monitilora ramsayi)]|nr:hypothetical protein [Candidatus Thiodiazotropha sp. (ex Monitilora ramsayi)]